MKAYELLNINESLLKVMDSLSLAISDVKYVPVIKEYLRLMGEGNKKTYVVQVLSDKYDIAERTLYRVVDKMMGDVELN